MWLLRLFSSGLYKLYDLNRKGVAIVYLHKGQVFLRYSYVALAKTTKVK